MTRFEELQRSIHGTSWLDNAARASLSAASAKFENRRPPILAVDVNAELDATTLSVISRQMQSAVARMSRHILHPDSEASRIYDDDRDRARLFPRRQIGRRIEFGFENLDIVEPSLFFTDTASVAEIAATELVSLLPSAPHDSAAIESMPAHDRALLNVIRDVVTAVEETAGVGLTVSSASGEQTVGVLTRDQAYTIGADLRESTQERRVVTVVGRLDGVRTRRRLFYLETEGRDYEGVYDPDLAGSVKRHLDLPVQARIEMVRSVRKAGAAGRWSYRLLSLDDRPLGTGLFDPT